MPGGVASIEEAVGLRGQGRALSRPADPREPARAPALVERNAVVRMSYRSGPLRIVTEGRALDRAAAGEPVRVMNLTSKQTVTGVGGG